MIYMTQKSILVATYCPNGHVFTGHTIGILKLENMCASIGVALSSTYISTEIFPQKAKNTLCSIFMKSSHSHLLLIDHDIEFDAEDIIKMMEFDQPVVGGLTYKQTIRWDKLAEIANQKGEKNLSIDTLKTISRDYNFIPKDDNMKNMDFNAEFNDVDAIGTGVLLLQKDALTKIESAFPKDKYFDNGETLFRYFDTGVKNLSTIKSNIYMEDDVWFCNRWRELGGKIYVHTKFCSKHWGIHGF